MLKLPRCLPGILLEDLTEIPIILKTNLKSDLVDHLGRAAQKLLCLLDPNGIQVI